MAVAAGQPAAVAAWWRRRSAEREFHPDLAPATRAGLLPWAAVWLALGIGVWFSLPAQPGWLLHLVCATAGLAGLQAMRLGARLSPGGILPAWIGPDALRRAGFCLALIATGVTLAGLRAQRVEAPVLGFRYYGPVEGRLVEIDRSGRDRMRLTLDRVRLERMAPERTPERVRLTLTEPPAALPDLGSRVMLTGHLGPPPGPAEPGGFDFRRTAWFERLGAVGYTRNPVLIAAPAEPGGALRLHRLRLRLSQAMVDRIGGQAGAVAAALMTGDRSHIAEDTNVTMRASNLYHIISISGLHMGMLAGFLYGGLRLLIVAGQAAAMGTGRWPGSGAARAPEGVTRRRPEPHHLAALGAMAGAAGYLWLSGGGVATERAFIMVAVMLGAILAGRRAISLRTVALAALVILALAPEALLTPGFQMSFAATVALILLFPPWQARTRGWPWWLRPVAMLVLSSAVAGLATSPIAAAHFSRMAQYGVLANLLVVPVMGTLVMPMGVVAAVLAPLGLAGPALWVMGLGTRWMLAVGEWVAGLEGAVIGIAQPPAAVLPVLGMGAVLLLLSPAAGGGRWRRAAGLALIAAGCVGWASAERPALLISDQGDAVALQSPAGRVPSRSGGAAFTVSEWLEKDGETVTREEASSRAAWRDEGRARVADWGAVRGADWGAPAVRVVHLSGKGSRDALAPFCRGGAIIVTDQPASAAQSPARGRRAPSDEPFRGWPGPGNVAEAARQAASRELAGEGADCLLFTPELLRHTGSVSARAGPGWPERRLRRVLGMAPDTALRFESASARSGRRPWSAR